MRTELFRLSPDEAALVQLYRVLGEDYKVALASMATNLAATTSNIKKDDKVVLFVRSHKIV